MNIQTGVKFVLQSFPHLIHSDLMTKFSGNGSHTFIYKAARMNITELA